MDVPHQSGPRPCLLAVPTPANVHACKEVSRQCWSRSRLPIAALAINVVCISTPVLRLRVVLAPVAVHRRLMWLRWRPVLRRHCVRGSCVRRMVMCMLRVARSVMQVRLVRSPAMLLHIMGCVWWIRRLPALAVRCMRMTVRTMRGLL
jgi:hypothetical protein